MLRDPILPFSDSRERIQKDRRDRRNHQPIAEVPIGERVCRVGANNRTNVEYILKATRRRCHNNLGISLTSHDGGNTQRLH